MRSRPTRTGRLGSIHAKLLLLVAVAIVPALSLALGNGMTQRQASVAHTQEEALSLARVAATSHTRLIEETQHVLAGLAQVPDVQLGEGAACTALFAQIMRDNPLYSNLGVVQLDGTMTCSGTPMAGVVSVADRRYFQEVLANQQFAADDYVIGRISGKPALLTGYPMFDESGQLRAVLHAGLDLSWLTSLAHQAQVRGETRMTVLTAESMVLLQYPQQDGVVGQPISNLDQMRGLLATGREGSGVFQAQDGARYLFAYTPLDLGAANPQAFVRIAVPETEVLADDDGALAQHVLGLALVAAVAAALAWVVGHIMIVRPLHALVLATRRLATGDLAARSGLAAGRGELGALAVAFDQMASSLQRQQAELAEARDQALEASQAHRHAALHDHLTDLPNRALFVDRLEQALARAQRHRRRVAVLFLDLDNFKLVNDSLGHHPGDTLLVEVARRLQAGIRAGDIVARLGGDEFTVLLEDVADEAEATTAAERIAEALRAPIPLAGREVFVTASIGVALSGPHSAHADTLLRNADIAMYQAKAAGKARVAVFGAHLEAQAVERLELETDLRQALQRGEFQVYYQPIQSLADGRTAEVEALLRWQRPGRGLVPPTRFIPAAEETGLIIPIGQWVLEEACRQARAWQAAYPSNPPLVMSVNLSARQFQHPSLVADIQQALQAAELDPRTLKLEITESVAMHDAEATVAKLQALKALGIQLAIDDFGTGYSSLAYLKQFPVDTLKIDRSFVDGVGQDAQDTAIVQSVVALAKTLGLQVTGEGIETPAQAAQLRMLGCDRGQGYLFARPHAAETISSLLAGAARAAAPRAA